MIFKLEKNRRSKYIVTAVVVLFLASTVDAARSYLVKKRSQVVLQEDTRKAKGNFRAPVQVIEYSDFQCPACAAGAATLKEYFITHPQSLHVQYRYYPLLSAHPHALTIAVYAECAAQQKKFWDFHDAAFERQNLLRETINLAGRLAEIAGELGLNKKTLDACVNNPVTRQAVLKEKEAGEAKGVNSTPTYFINGKMFVGRSGLLRGLKQYLEKGSDEEN